MTSARGEVLTDGEAIYHCYTRCVRRAFLCGFDAYSGRNFDHRKDWVRERLKQLSEIFAIDVLEYALMGNHTHSVLRTRPDIVKGLEAEEVARRWLTLYPPSGAADPDELRAAVRVLSEDTVRIEQLRDRLASISWYMKSLNEHIARRANKEDKCKGRFWESRFKCQRLWDEAAVLSCAVYVVLNPIRAKAASSPEESDFTSIQERIREFQGSPSTESKLWLSPIQDTKVKRGFLSISLPEYLTLIDTTGREIREGKRGAIARNLEPILIRLGINPVHWVQVGQHFGHWFATSAGTAPTLVRVSRSLGKLWCKGLRVAQQVFL